MIDLREGTRRRIRDQPSWTQQKAAVQIENGIPPQVTLNVC